jgi:Terpene cyclase DEP1
VKPKNVYLFLCALGLAIPYSQFVPWLHENGLNFGLLVHQLFINRISTFFGLDVLVSSVVLLVFMGVEGRLLRMRLRWLPVAGLCAVGVSLALPLFLYLRERALEAAGGASRDPSGSHA